MDRKCCYVTISILTVFAYLSCRLESVTINSSNSRRGIMTVMKTDKPRSPVTVTRLEEFLRNPPPGFTVEEPPGSGYRVHSDPETSLVLIDDLDSCRGKVVFYNSCGR